MVSATCRNIKGIAEARVRYHIIRWNLPPAMAAELTDRVWTLREVLLFRVPPWPQPAGV